MKKEIADGVWPTMVTPFTDKNEIDYHALEELIEWYINNKADGLFAVCQSSEMFYLSLEERVCLASFVAGKAKGRIPVIASGHISEEPDKQIEEVRRIADTGIDAVVLITNRFMAEGETEETFKRNLERFLSAIPADIQLGLYECPYPCKRLMTPELLKWCALTDRFLFLKDTSCDPVNIANKLEAIKGTGLKLYNANSATLLQSLKEGACGYSGILGNFFPELFAWLIRNWKSKPEMALALQNFLGVAAPIEKRIYPVCAKHYQQLNGVHIQLHSRMQNSAMYLQTPSFGVEIQQLHELAREYKERYGK